jgi:CRISPR/Cas system-associated exonuclease Cas4 (RecB family)
MSLLSPDFQFSQRNLQDYVDCRRRFQLRYLEQLAWPAVEAEPLIEHEYRLQAGAAFHRLVQRYLLEVPAEALSGMVESSSMNGGELKRWWQNFLQYAEVAPAENSLVEGTLSAPIGGYRLLAKYDLIRWGKDLSKGKVTIIDWKTSQLRPPRTWQADRLQTRVYPYLLVQAGAPIIGLERLSPEQIEMVYWYAEHPREPQRFAYSPQQYQLDHDYLIGLVGEIEMLAEGDFYLTSDESRCKYCTYRSLCDRGTTAGLLGEVKFDFESGGSDDLDLDFDQIAEIEF